MEHSDLDSDESHRDYVVETEPAGPSIRYKLNSAISEVGESPNPDDVHYVRSTIYFDPPRYPDDAMRINAACVTSPIKKIENHQQLPPKLNLHSVVHTMEGHATSQSPIQAESQHHMHTSSNEVSGSQGFASHLQPIECQRELPSSGHDEFPASYRRAKVPESAEQRDLVTFGLANRPDSSLLQITSDKHASSNMALEKRQWQPEPNSARSGDIESYPIEGTSQPNGEEYST